MNYPKKHIRDKAREICYYFCKRIHDGKDTFL